MIISAIGNQDNIHSASSDSGQVKVTLSWSVNQACKSGWCDVDIYLYDSTNALVQSIKKVRTSSTTITIDAGKTYKAVITPYNSLGIKGYTKERVFSSQGSITPVTKPSKPKSVVCSTAKPRNIEVTWQNDGSYSYKVYVAQPPSKAEWNEYYTDLWDYSDAANGIYTNCINAMKELDIVDDCGTGLFCPDIDIKRRELAQWFIKALKFETSTAVYNAYFTDVSNDSWAGYINKIYELGIDSGCVAPQKDASGTILIKGQFCPTSAITRSLAAMWVIKAMNDTPSTVAFNVFYTDVYNDQYTPYINKLAEHGVITGATFSPSANFKRKDAAFFLVLTAYRQSYAVDVTGTKTTINIADYSRWITVRVFGIINGIYSEVPSFTKYFIPYPQSPTTVAWSETLYQNTDGSWSSKVSVVTTKADDWAVAGHDIYYRVNTGSWIFAEYSDDGTTEIRAPQGDIDVKAVPVSIWDTKGTGVISTQATLVGDTTPPNAPTGLTATSIIDGITLEWNDNTDDDFDHYELYRNTVNNSGTSTKINICMTSKFTDSGDITVGNTYYYWLKAVDHHGNISGFSTGANAIVGQAEEGDIADFAITASKIFTKIPILSGDSWTDNSPSAGYAAWNQHDLYYNGVKYIISAGDTNLKYIYWTGSTTYQASNTNPTLTDGQFIIATNISGTHDLAWNAIANEVIGSAYIQQASIINAHINDLSADKINAGSINITWAGGSLRSGQTAYDTGIGFWIGNVSGTPKLSIGNSVGQKILWDGTSVSVVGTLDITGTNYRITVGKDNIGTVDGQIHMYSGATQVINIGKSTIGGDTYLAVFEGITAGLLTGVYGTGISCGIHGYSINGIGVRGISDTDKGGLFQGNSGPGLVASSGTGPALLLQQGSGAYSYGSQVLIVRRMSSGGGTGDLVMIEDLSAGTSYELLHIIKQGSSKFIINSAGSIGSGTYPYISDGIGLHIAGKIIRLDTSKTPASSGATGNQGEICWDSNYVYVCTATNSWKRATLSTF